jgi:hypothetical protein
MNDAYTSRPPTRVLRWVRAYAPPLRDRFPPDEQPADEMMDLLEQADRRRGSGEAGGGD